MFGIASVGNAIPIFSNLANWILMNPSMTARRGIYIGIGLGTIATSLRVILGVERTYLGKE
jgi:ribonucleotide monophosphatase NagD (HAD superfamily)